MSFVPPGESAVAPGLLTPDAGSVIDLRPLGCADMLDVLGQLDAIRQVAGALVHGGGARVALDQVELVGALPLVRSVVVHPDGALHFDDPRAMHGPGVVVPVASHAATAVGLAAVLGADGAPSATMLACGWPDRDGHLVVQGVGAMLGVPPRWPAAIEVGATSVAMHDAAERVAAAVARARGRYTLRAGDLVAWLVPVTLPINRRVPVRAAGIGFLRLETLAPVAG